MKKIIIVGGGVILVALLCFFFGKSFIQKENATQKVNAISALFECKDKKTIQSIFLDSNVELTLSDGRTMLLKQAVSASGARYANSDETFVFWNKGDTAFVEEKSKVTFDGCIEKKDTNKPTSEIGNPASINCKNVGGSTVIQKRGDGAEYGLCYFEENRACEEWALLRGECPIGGRKTTGYDTIDQNYCAWIGGETMAVKDSVCTFKNGSQCPTKSLYEGSCIPAKLIE